MTTTLASGGTVFLEKGVFIIEFSASGDAIAAGCIATPTSFNNILAIATDNNDNIIIGASIDGPMDLDLGTGTVLDTSHSAYNGVVVKYNSSLQYQWHKVFGDIPEGQPGGWDVVGEIQCDDNGNIYATGYFTWTTDFDPDDNPGTYVVEAGTAFGSQTPDGFIVKYDAQGNIQWVQDAGTHPSITTNTDVNFLDMVLKDDQIVVSGTLNGGADFDGGVDSFFVSTADGGLGLCYEQYTTSGDFVNAWLIDGIQSNNETHAGIEQLANGIVAYGLLQYAADFDPTSGEYILYVDTNGFIPDFDNDIFVAHYDLDLQTSVSETEIGNSLVYPNPSSTGVFQFSTPFEREEVFSIYNLTGKLVQQNSSPTQIDLSAHPAGVYVVQFDNPELKPLKLVKR